MLLGISIFVVICIIVFVTLGVVLSKSNGNSNTAPISYTETFPGLTKFSLTSYSSLAPSTSHNFIFSPLSIDACLAMVYEGAAGTTASQMETALQFSRDKTPIVINSLLHAFNAANTTDVSLVLSDRIFVDAGFPLKSSFVTTMASTYDSACQQLDFQTQPEQSRVTINDWVASKTNQKILDLLAQGTVSSATRIVLVNALYFNAHFVYPFDPDYTAPAAFTLQDGSTVDAQFMRFPTHEPCKQERSNIIQSGGERGEGRKHRSLDFRFDEFARIVVSLCKTRKGRDQRGTENAGIGNASSSSAAMIDDVEFDRNHQTVFLLFVSLFLFLILFSIPLFFLRLPSQFILSPCIFFLSVFLRSSGFSFVFSISEQEMHLLSSLFSSFVFPFSSPRADTRVYLHSFLCCCFPSVSWFSFDFDAGHCAHLRLLFGPLGSSLSAGRPLARPAAACPCLVGHRQSRAAEVRNLGLLAITESALDLTWNDKRVQSYDSRFFEYAHTTK